MPFALPALGSMLFSKISVAANFLLIGAIVLILVGKNADIKRLTREKATVVGERDKANQNLGICRANNATYRVALDKQNSSIATMARLAEEQEARGTEMLKQVRQNGQVVTKIQRIRDTRPTQDLCVSADNLIKESIR